MHTTVIQDRAVQHNGDFRGDVTIAVSTDEIGINPFGGADVTLPFELLKKIVAEWKRNQLISELEDAETDAILKDW